MVSIGDTEIGEGNRPYIIAEVGINAQDNVELAKAFINTAADAGADAVKFQTHLPDDEMVQSEMDRLGNGDVYEVISGCVLSRPDHKELKQHCEFMGIDFLSTPFSFEAVELLDDVGVPAVKIGSGELTNYPLLRRASDVDVPLLISTGMSDFKSIKKAHEFIQQEVSDFAYLYCVSAYPANPRDFNLDTISRMKSQFDVPIGFSDHSTGIEAAAIAMAKGADFVEKHFTIDRRLPGPDQEVSIEPEELERLVEFAEYVDKTSGEEKHVIEEETDVKAWARHSVVTQTSLSAGQVLHEEDLTTKRPGTGIPASEFYEVVGAKLGEDIGPNEVLKWSHIVEN